jgi:hypothetical protein
MHVIVHAGCHVIYEISQTLQKDEVAHLEITRSRTLRIHQRLETQGNGYDLVWNVGSCRRPIRAWDCTEG